ncbi:aspartate-semialdehyde dehydrogenase [Simkania negevensis]|uniref:Aspartate-semialdehyde dehydrogenase n=1 Tax=Simkania negevensis TaxID=83561 RepID=A0ABS3AVL2_9BACT|nr:aspartate-semialdehyde dehydrogenase [Simkania negevensis]
MKMFEQEKIPLAVVGATGLVGQKAIAMIDHHPEFYVAEIAASDQRAGQTFEESVCWREPGDIPKSVCTLKLKPIKEVNNRYVISALPASVAQEVEPALASQGSFVFTNASAFRMHQDVPILIPEINIDHLSLLERQKTPGKIITNSNCMVAFIALALEPLMELGAIEHVSVVTMQAISGAGYPSIDSIDIMGNIIPHIAGEEEKIITETLKILGTQTQPASFGITVHVHRVPILHGHTVALHIHFASSVNMHDINDIYLSRNQSWPGLYRLYHEVARPQPARDIGPYDQSVHIGRIKQGARDNIIGLIAMGNNLARGAAGASVRNMEATLQYNSSRENRV